MTKCKDNQERRFYIISTKKFGSSKNILVHQIENKTYEKYLLGQTNFDTTLPDTIKNQAIFAVKDEYTFDFIDLSDEHTEGQLELALVNNIRAFLLEMGSQFTFIGNQFKLRINDKEYLLIFCFIIGNYNVLLLLSLKLANTSLSIKVKWNFT